MRVHPETFELRVERDDYSRRTLLRIDSRRYDVRLTFQLRNDWGDPRRLADQIELLVGGTLAAWERAGVGSAGREMAHALLPMWEREIHRFMERMEYEGTRRERYARHRDEFMASPRYFYDEWWAFDDWAPKEDPKAKEKARQLLLRNLDAGQEKSFKKDGEFRVTAKDGKVYTIKTARSFNVVAEDGTKYCGQLRDTPIEDQMLAQKLLLQSDPEQFFKNANVSPAPGATTATMRWQTMADAINLRPGGVIRWDSSV